MLENLLWILFFFASFIVVYHHFIYPIILRTFCYFLPNKISTFKKRDYQTSENDNELPTITIVIPIRNEENTIVHKLNNIKSFDYPDNKLKVLLLLDQCTDKSEEKIKDWQNNNKEPLNLTLVSFSEHQGKVKLLNYAIKRCDTELIGFTDVSALISFDALLIAASHFADPKVGIVAGLYQLLSKENHGEALYWKYQTQIKINEGKTGGPIGVSGSGYFVRSNAIELIPLDTINDDFILSMEIVVKGYRAVYEPKINIIELEPTLIQRDLERRKRISAGNWQQFFRLKRLLHPHFGGISLNFLSGKVIRIFIPFALIIIFLSSLGLSIYYSWFIVIITLQLVLYSIAVTVYRFKLFNRSKLLSFIHYFVYGHFITFIGLYRYLRGYYNSPWQRATLENDGQFMHPIVSICKWCIDKLAAIFMLFITLLLLPFLALVIKIDSNGPIFHRQLRIGRQWPSYTEIFNIFKFRTIYLDKELNKKIKTYEDELNSTFVGKFLRKTHLDELPLFMSVFLGQMSLFGPRPEHPKFYAKLEKEIPFFSERIFGIKPGIFGLAQALDGNEEAINDFKNQVAFDHAYALSLSKPREWVKMECYIILLTFKTMFNKGTKKWL